MLDGPSVNTIKVQVTDQYGATSTDEATVNILNVTPMVGPINAPLAPVTINTPITVNAAFTDPGILDTHTVSIDWGDGFVTAGTVVEDHGSGTASGAHAYGTPGVYKISMTVTDKDGASATSIFEYVVVYDPNGGFVTGGGWIMSPAGAYQAGPTLTGKATFGFVAKYKKGATVPDGNTEFQFKAGDLNFHSTNYQWLVVNQNYTNAQFKGYGTINGEGNYGFMIWAGDGSPDTFRIKIWDASNEEDVVYDNGVQQPIGGGSIVIHK